MAAPWGRFFQKRVLWSGVASSLRHYSGVTQSVPHKCKLFSVCSNPHTITSTSTIDGLAKRLANHCVLNRSSNRQFSSLTDSSRISTPYSTNLPYSSSLLQPTSTYIVQPKRTIIRYSLTKGKKKSVRAVIDRFYRFNSGLWLRCRAGRNKKLWKKSPQRKRRIKQFVFCSGNQSKKLDKMVTAYWRRQKHIPDDPFAPFENRNWYGYKDHPGSHYIDHMFKKNAPLNMPYKDTKVRNK